MEAWWEKYESMCESWNREREERRRLWAERDTAHERYLAEQAVRHEAEREAAAVAEREAAAEREAKAAEEREAEAERERAVAEAEEDAAEKYEQSATVTVFVGSSKAFGFLNESSVLPKINVVLPQFDVVLPQFDAVLLQFRDLGLEIVFPQISDLGFAVSPKIGNSGLSIGVLADHGGDSAIDGAGRPPRKPPDSFFCSGELCFLAADSWRQRRRRRLILEHSGVGTCMCFVSATESVLTRDSYMPVLATRPPVSSFLTGDSCKMVMARRPPAKPPDPAEDDGERKEDEAVKDSILSCYCEGEEATKEWVPAEPLSHSSGPSPSCSKKELGLADVGSGGERKKGLESVWV